MLYQYAIIASRPDKEIKTARKKKKKKKNTRLQHYSGLIKERCTAEARVQNKSSYQQGQMLKKSCIHTVIIPSVLLITKFCCAQALSCENPRVSNYRSNYPISGHSPSFGLLNWFKIMHGDVAPRRSFKFKFFYDTDKSRVGSSQKQMEDFCVKLRHW